MSPVIDGLSGLTEVGRGGFGVVYRAQEERFGRDVAVKLIRDVGLGKDVVARFERECLALGSLSGHPNIVSVYDSGSTQAGEFYLVMEYLGGGSLAQRLATRGPASPEDVVTWGAALAGALETAHRSGIIHRDVKPENILFSGYGVPKLVDFGIARMRSAYETRSGFISATLNHAAPEVVAGSSVAPAADVYSLASVLFTALSGHAPFDHGSEDSLAPLIARIASADPPDLRERGVPDAVAAVIERGLAKTAKERFENAAAFGRALQEAARSVFGREVVLPLGDEEHVAEAAALVGPATGGEEDTVERRATPAQSSPAAPVTGSPSRPSRLRHPLVLVAAGLSVLLAGTWVVTALRGDGTADVPSPGAMPTVTTMSGAVDGMRLDDAVAKKGPLSALRSYAFVGEDRVGSTVELRNTTTEPVTQVWVEVIPKNLAVRVGQVSFEPAITGVIEEDPIVYWTVTLKPGAVQSISWSTTIPGGRQQGQELLQDVRAWHRAMVKDSSKQVAQARKSLGGTASGTPAGPGDPVDAGSPITSPVLPGSAGVPAAPGNAGGSGPGTPSGVSGAPSGPGSTGGGKTGKTGKANRKPVITVRAQQSSEMTAVSYTFGVSDPDGDSYTVRSVTGLPAGLRAGGNRISGTISHSAANATRNFRSGLGRETKTVRVTVADKHGAVSTASFAWVVIDSHRLMPDYRGKWGDGSDGLPNVYHITSNAGTTCHDADKEPDRIAKQSKVPGSVLRFGEAVTYTYYTRNSSRPDC